MPGLDRTGPEGQGSQTGRKQGKCNTENDTLTEDRPTRFGLGLRRRFRNRLDINDEQNFKGGLGRGMGRGRGLGRGRR